MKVNLLHTMPRRGRSYEPLSPIPYRRRRLEPITDQQVREAIDYINRINRRPRRQNVRRDDEGSETEDEEVDIMPDQPAWVEIEDEDEDVDENNVVGDEGGEDEPADVVQRAAAQGDHSKMLFQPLYDALFSSEVFVRQPDGVVLFNPERYLAIISGALRPGNNRASLVTTHAAEPAVEFEPTIDELIENWPYVQPGAPAAPPAQAASDVNELLRVDSGRIAPQELPANPLRDLYVEYAIKDGPMLASINDGTMRVPWHSVYNLKVTLFLYLLEKIAVACAGFTYPEPFRVTFWASRADYGEELQRSLRRIRGLYEDSTPIHICKDTFLSDHITLDTIMSIFSEMVVFFHEEKDFRDYDGTATWVENELDSGDRICFSGWYNRVISGNANDYFKFYISIETAMFAEVAMSFTERVRLTVEKVFEGSCVKVVTNTDDYCFLYTLLMGVYKLYYPSCLADKSVYVTPQHIIAIAMSQCDGWIHWFAEQIVTKNNRITELIEQRIERRYSLKEFARIMSEIESECLKKTPSGDEPPDVGIDIYVMDGEKRIYPAYASPRKCADRIQMIAIARPSCAHFVLITNPKLVWKKLGGKYFFTCTKCSQSFFTRSLMLEHVCGEDRESLHWNQKSACDQADICCGVCWKCRLKFDSDDAFAFHKENCFMKGRSGYRIVLLPEEETLKGVIDTRKALPTVHLCFADFECYIDEHGEHKFMSGGLYNETTKEFTIVYTMEEFMEMVEAISKRHKKIKIFFHNAMNYDANFILKYILQHEKYDDWSIQIIMKSSNKLQKLSFMWQDGSTKRIIEIGDTYLFMTMSLDRIVSSVRKETTDENRLVFPRFFQMFGQRYFVADMDINMILRKNLFPYMYFRSADLLDTNVEEFRKVFEPTAENLKYFALNVTVENLRENIDDFDSVVRKFGCGTARDYHDVYLMCDVLQIADVFMAARETLWKSHHIDISEYMGMPSASWAAFLRFDPALEIPLYSSTIFAEFFSRMTRGGVTSAPLRYAVADESHSIIYLDVNGLYPFVMREFAYPCGGFVWITPSADSESDPMNWLRTKIEQCKNEGNGFAACVDLHYTREVKDATDQFPFAPDHMLINDQYYDESGELYPFLKEWSQANEGEVMKPFKGLVGTLYDKERYCVHWKLLEWYMDHGLIVTKVHNIVLFQEAKYLSGYVNHNITLRNQRTDELGKMVYKLMGNSIYGKTFENPFNHYKYVLVRNEMKLKGLIETADVASITPIDQNNSIVKITGDRVELDKPTYVGACVTEYAKLHMYRLFYDKFMKMFPSVELVYTDTDSFIIRVEHDPALQGQALLDYMNRDEPLIGREGGLIKSETGTDFIREVVALRSKLYSYETLSGKIDVKAKGVSEQYKKAFITHADMVATMATKKIIALDISQIQRTHMTVRNIVSSKKCVSIADGKRKIEDDGIHTHAFGF